MNRPQVRIVGGVERAFELKRALSRHLIREHGEVHVSWRVSGFKKIKFYSRENVGFGEVHLPDHEMHTTSFWMTFREDMLFSLEFNRSQILDGVVGLAYCLHHLAPVYLMCDHRDLDRCVGDRSGEWFARPDETGQGRYTTQIPDKVEDEAVSESWMRVGVLMCGANLLAIWMCS